MRLAIETRRIEEESVFESSSEKQFFKERTHREHEAYIHCNEGNSKKRSHADTEIKLVDLEEMIGLIVLDESKHG